MASWAVAPRGRDALLAGVLAITGLLELLGGYGWTDVGRISAAHVALVLAVTLPLAWRNSFPVPVCLGVQALYVSGVVLGVPMNSFAEVIAAFVVSTYTLVVTAPSTRGALIRVAACCVVIVAAGVAVAVTITATTPAIRSDGAGSAALGTTSYASPPSGIYVSPSGSDSAIGTSGAPVRTLTQAINIASSGSTIVLRAGRYHESAEVPSDKRLNIQSAPDSAVWLDGSSVVVAWTQRGTTWIHTGWTAQFDYTPSYTGTVSTQPGFGFVDPAYPYAAQPDQMWIDGTALTQVGSAARVTAGTFFADYAGKRLIIGSDPNGQDVRASDLGVALTVRSANSTVRGIGVRRYATAVKDLGALRLTAPGIAIENVVTSDNATTGLTVLSTGQSVSNVTAERNGMLGILGNNADNLVISKVLSRNNNLERFNSAPVAGGIKITRTRGITLKDSVVQDNLATGLWLDESCYNAVVAGNSILDNTTHGFAMEISSTAVVADNVITGSGSDGVKINNADNVRLWNNTLAGNAINMALVQDSRDYLNKSIPGHDPRQTFPDPTMTWKLGNIQVMNTILARGGHTNIYARDYTAERGAAQMNIKIAGDLFTRTTSPGDSIVVWGLRSGTLSYLRTVAEIANTGAGSDNAEVVSDAASPNIAATTYAQPLPADIATLIGQPAGTRKVGAF